VVERAAPNKGMQVPTAFATPKAGPSSRIRSIKVVAPGIEPPCASPTNILPDNPHCRE